MSETEKSSQQSDGGVALNESLSFNEVAKLFSMPIAEAAGILGVCSSVLKKICRDNGLVRWPYRKDSSKSQQGVPMVGHASQHQGNKPLQQGRQNMFHSSHLRNIPTYLDEFKQGFPTDGLSSVSTRWWGTSSAHGTEMLEEVEPTTEEAEKQPSRESPRDEVMTEEKPERETQKDDAGAALLSSLRKRAAEEGREAVKLGVARGYDSNKLRKKERVMLIQIFRSCYPSQWK